MDTKRSSAGPVLAAQDSQVIAGRYVIERELGQGGSGAVWLVRDREAGERLALKRLIRVDAEGAARLKHEFRALAGVGHRNLIRLYELGYDRGSAFFTMEYVQGTDLLEHLAVDPSIRETRRDRARPTEHEHVARVLSAFQQIAGAVHALHSAGVLHRDLKPSNVMVSGERIVVLDFGLALAVGADARTITRTDSVAGTPAYMAPEQIRGDHFSEANDWYSFGAMLYEALSGSLPIEGRLHELLDRKLTQDPIPIDRLVPGLSSEVAELCMALLRREPSERPRGPQVLAVLARADQQNAKRTQTHTLSIPTNEKIHPFVGRSAELETLERAFAATRAGQFVVAHVFGDSGAGKSALVDHFLAKIERPDLFTESQAIVLRSRCYERETMPFKALDGIIDAIVDYLSRASAATVGYTLPQELSALVQLFPALERLPSVKMLLARPKAVQGAIQTRDEAEAALREMLTRLSVQRPVVLYIDDLQWGDLDSAGVLKNWLQPPQIPGVLLVLCYRSEEIATSACVATLRKERLAAPAIELFVPMNALGDAEIRALCERELAAAGGVTVSAEWIERMVREADGSPFLALQLTSLARARLPEAALGGVSVQELTARQAASLSEPARRLLDVFSVAGRPISLSLALRAADLARDVRAAVHELHGARLIRTREIGGERLLELYHDRLREAFYAALDADARHAIDRALLRELQAMQSGDVDWLHALASAVGDRETALRYGIAAAERASTSLAFEHAAELYERCLAQCTDADARAGELWHKRAVALAYAGHGARAAAAYLEAARRVDPQTALSYERLAASHLLRSGRFEEGEQLLAKVLRALSLEPPESEAGLFAAIAWERTRLAIRGMRFTPRPRSEVPLALAYTIELCATVSIETGAYDPLRALLYQARALRMALESGDAELIARVLCLAATIECASGTPRAVREASATLDRAEALAREVDSPLVHTNVCSARTVIAFLSSRLEETLEYSLEAERLHRQVISEGEYHHRFTVIAARIGALMQLGEVQRAEKELVTALREAEATDNVSAILHLALSQTRADIAADRPEVAVARLTAQQRLLPQHSFGLLHMFHMLALMRAYSAMGAHAEGLRKTEAAWNRFQRSVVRRSATYSMIGHATHARLVLNACVAAGRSAEARREVAPDLKGMLRSQAIPAPGTIARTRARIAYLGGDPQAAARLLHESAEWFERSDGKDEAARDRYALGVILGGAEGARLCTNALERMRAVGLVNPLRDLAGYYPELLR